MHITIHRNADARMSMTKASFLYRFSFRANVDIDDDHGGLDSSKQFSFDQIVNLLKKNSFNCLMKSNWELFIKLNELEYNHSHKNNLII